MAQYKASMERLFGSKQRAITSEVRKKLENPFFEQIISFFEAESDFIIHSLVPVIWTILFVLIMDRSTFISTLYLPFLGLFAAILANAVPIGGGIVYVPALALLGVDLHLGVAFSVSVMSFGNGLFGFLKWLKKNPNAFIWESFQYTIIPSSLGSIIAILFLPPLSKHSIRLFFAYFCFILSIFVFVSAYYGGVEKLFPSSNNHNLLIELSSDPSSQDSLYFSPPLEVPPNSPFPSSPPRSTTSTGSIQFDYQSTGDIEEVTKLELEKEGEGGIVDQSYLTLPPPSPSPSHQTIHQDQSPSSTPLPHTHRHTYDPSRASAQHHFWFVLSIVSFLAGLYLVPNLGVGPALTTFLALSLAGASPQHAMITSIVTGGWVSIVPFIFHACYLKDVPFHLWVMVLPGVYCGAKLAPFVHERLGASSLLGMFGVFLLVTTFIFILKI